MKRRLHTTYTEATEDAVERPGLDQAPTAWRIWRAGENVADDGSVYFTSDSAKALLEEQDARQRRYAIDFDHLSLTSDRPAEAGRAAGWHSLEVRGGELWAVQVEWCTDAKAGLEEKPPRWKYFSPAFNVNEKGEVVGYINCALCVNPMSRGIPALAAHGGVRKQMDKEKICAALLALAGGEGLSEEQKSAVMAAHAMLAEPPAPPAEEEKKEAEPPPEDHKEPDGDEVAEKKAHAAVAPAPVGHALAMDVARLAQRVAQLETEKMLASRVDLPESVRRWCMTQSREVVESYLSSVAKTAPMRHAVPAAGERGPVGLQGAELDELERGMGIRRAGKTGPGKDEHGRFVLHTTRPSELKVG